MVHMNVCLYAADNVKWKVIVRDTLPSYLVSRGVHVYMCGPSHNACVTGPTLSHDIEIITFVINDIHDLNMKQIGNRIRTDLKDGNRNARLALSA